MNLPRGPPLTFPLGRSHRRTPRSGLPAVSLPQPTQQQRHSTENAPILLTRQCFQARTLSCSSVWEFWILTFSCMLTHVGGFSTSCRNVDRSRRRESSTGSPNAEKHNDIDTLVTEPWQSTFHVNSMVYSDHPQS